MLLWSSAPIYAEQVGLTELYAGIRESTLQNIALRRPGDLIRLRDALNKAERELARMLIKASPGQFDVPEQCLNWIQDRLLESRMIFQQIDRYGKKMPVRQVDRISAEEHASLRGELLDRINALQEAIGTLEKAIRSEQAEYIRTLIDERKNLDLLLAVRRVELLAEYARFPDCHAADQPCLQNKLRALCNLKPLASRAERLPILRLIAEVDSRLNAGGQTESTSCESL